MSSFFSRCSLIVQTFNSSTQQLSLYDTQLYSKTNVQIFGCKINPNVDSNLFFFYSFNLKREFGIYEFRKNNDIFFIVDNGYKYIEKKRNTL